MTYAVGEVWASESKVWKILSVQHKRSGLVLECQHPDHPDGVRWWPPVDVWDAWIKSYAATRIAPAPPPPAIVEPAIVTGAGTLRFIRVGPGDDAERLVGLLGDAVLVWASAKDLDAMEWNGPVTPTEAGS